jgi:hypothetical protein
MKLFNLKSLYFVFSLVLLLSFASAGKLEVTPEHPFLIDGEWVSASELQVGDLMQTIDGRQVRITNITGVEVSEEESFSVYNLEAGIYHNFVVCGDDVCDEDSVGVVVKNSNVGGKRIKPGFITRHSPSTEAILADGRVVIERTLNANTKSMHIITFDSSTQESSRAILAALKYAKSHPQYNYVLHTPTSELIGVFDGSNLRFLNLIKSQGFTIKNFGNVKPSWYRAASYRALSGTSPPSSAWKMAKLESAQAGWGFFDPRGVLVELPATTIILAGGITAYIKPGEVFIDVFGAGKNYVLSYLEEENPQKSPDL